MNRNRFTAPPGDNRVASNLFTTPPPNFNWQGSPTASSDYPMAINASPFPNPPVQPPYNPNPAKKSYCKTCNSWTIEPYEYHVQSQSHLQNKVNNRNNQQFDPNDPPEQLMSIKCAPRINNQSYEQNLDSSYPLPRKIPARKSDQPFDPNIVNPQFPMIRPVLQRINDQPHDSINSQQFPVQRLVHPRLINQLPDNVNSQPFPITKKGATRATIPPFKISSTTDSNEDLLENTANKRIKMRKNRSNINHQNAISFNQNNFQSSHSSEGQYFDKDDNPTSKRIDETVKHKSKAADPVSSPITANKGREMLLSVSGVYCTLCDEFFRNTDAAETKHCTSALHIESYEKLQSQLKRPPIDNKPAADNRPAPDISKNDKQTIMKRVKLQNTPKTIKPTKHIITPSECATNNTPAVTVGISAPVTVRDSLDSDLTSSSEFQGPDVSLEFPDEMEDYDE